MCEYQYQCGYQCECGYQCQCGYQCGYQCECITSESRSNPNQIQIKFESNNIKYIGNHKYQLHASASDLVMLMVCVGPLVLGCLNDLLAFPPLFLLSPVDFLQSHYLLRYLFLLFLDLIKFRQQLRVMLLQMEYVALFHT